MSFATVAHWVTILSILVGASWFCVEAYDAFKYEADYGKAAWKVLAVLLAVASATISMWHPPKH